MTRILYHQPTATLVPYPRDDDGPVVGLDPTYLDLQLIQLPPPTTQPGEELRPTEVIDLQALTVTRGWEVLPPPPPLAPAPDWAGFAAWLYQFPAMAAAMAAARESVSPQGEPATTGLPAAMDEARLRANYLPFAQGWALFVAASELSETNLAAIVNMAELCHLPAEFLAALQPPLPEPPQ